MDKKIPVIIVGWNGSAYSKKCIDSVLASKEDNIVIVAVNNGSTDNTKELFESYRIQYPEKFEYIDLKDNTGFAHGYNTGIKFALEKFDCDYVFILNNDTEVPSYFLRHLIDGFGSAEKIGYQNIGAVGPIANNVGGSQTVNIKDIKTLEGINSFASNVYNKNKGIVTLSGILVGFAMLIKRQVFETIGFFDEDFGYGSFEDNDFCLRMRQVGFLSFVCRDTFIYHHGSKTIREIEKTVPDLFFKNRDIYIKKWAKINKYGIRKKVVGLCRVKNGALYLNEALGVVSKFCDDIVVFDDHSTDETEEICKNYSNIHYFKSPYNDFNEARDRNFMIDKVLELGGEWVFIFDHDEVPEESLVNNIQALVNPIDPMVKGYVFKIAHLWNNPGSVRVDGLWGPFYQGRLYKVEKNQYIIAKEDGLHCGAWAGVPSENLKYTKYRIKHYGNMDKKIRKEKYEWYTKTDITKDVNAILGGWANYYKSLYYKDRNAVLKDEDYYRHIVDETGLKLIPWREDNSISLCIIAKNEEKHIERLLKSAYGLVDEIVVTIDSSSTDKTEEICRKYTDKIYKYTWNDSGFSGMRNFCKSKASGALILFLDGDEYIPPEVGKLIIEAASDSSVTAYLCSFKNFLQKDNLDKWELSETFRFFKNEPYLYFTGKVHEDLSQSLEDASRYTNVVVSKFNGVFHNYGYLKDENFVSDKHKRYAELLKSQIDDDENDYRAHFNYATHLMHVKEYDEAEKHLKRVIEINPNMWGAYNALGCICFQKAMNQELLTDSQVWFQKALSKISLEPLCADVKRERLLKNLTNVNQLRSSMH